MVSTDTILCRPLERDIGVMIRFINLMHQRWTLLGPDTSDAVTGGAIGGEFRLAHLNIRRRRPTGWLRGILIRGIGLTSRQSRDQDGQHDSDHPHLQQCAPDTESLHRGGSDGVVVTLGSCDCFNCSRSIRVVRFNVNRR